MALDWKDTWNLMTKLNVSRFGNATLVVISYLISRFLGRSVHRGYPISLSIEPTTSCNLRCPECPSGLRSFSRPTGMLDKDFYQSVIDQLKDRLVYLTLYFQGEPYLNTDFLEMVKYASDSNIYTSTSTNGHFLTDDMARKTVEAGLDKLIVSMDGLDQETYEKYRVGGTLDEVLKGLERLLHWKKKLNSTRPFIVLQFIVMRQNQHQVKDLEEMARELGVDKVGIKTAQIYDFETGSDIMPTLQKYSRYRKSQNGTYEIKNSLLNSCWRMWHSCVITWDGKVVPCCFDKDASHQLGDLKERSFVDEWRGDAYQNFRNALIKSRKQIDICQNCTEGTRVWA